MLKVFSGKSKANTLKANLDRFENNILFGWALDTKNTSRKLILEILIDDELVTTIAANEFRPDLKESFGGDGKYAFTCSLDQSFNGTELGEVTLRDSETGRLVPVNHFSVKYDLSRLTGAQNKIGTSSGKDVLPGLNKFTKMLDHYNRKEFEKAKQIAENLLGKKDVVPDLIYEKLLSIYLSEENYISATELYYSVQKNRQNKALFITFSELMLAHCSSLWLSPSLSEWLSSGEIHKLEILMIVLENTGDIITEIEIEKVDNIDRLYLYFLKSGILLSSENIDQLINLLVDDATFSLDAKENTELYISTLPFVKQLHTAIHTIDFTVMPELHNYLDKTLTADKDSEYAKLLVSLYFTYVTALINSGTLADRNTVNTLLHMVHKLSKKYEMKSIQLDSIMMNLYYILGDHHRSLELFTTHGIENISALDWNCKYLSQIIWLYFKNSQYILNEDNLKEFLYKKQSEGRTAFLENAILLSDLNRWKESTDISLMYALVKDLTFGSFTERSEEVHAFVKKILKELSYGTLNVYYDNALAIQNYLDTKKSKQLPLSLHKTELFEFQNLYTLSLINDNDESIDNLTIDKKYKGLLHKNRRVDEITVNDHEMKSNDIAVFSVADDRYESSFLAYYQSMLMQSKGSHITLYLGFSQYFYQLSVQDNEIITVKTRNSTYELTEKLNEKNYDSYLVLGQNSVVHHRSFETFDHLSNTNYLSLFGDSQSFSIDHGFFQYFQQISKNRSYESLFDYLLDMNIGLSDLVRYGQGGFKEEKQGIVSFESIESASISRLTNFEYAIFELDDIEKSLPYLTMLYTDQRIEEITNINVGDVSMILLKESKSKDDELACFLVQRNEYLRMEGFLAYYRDMGVNTFYIVDNGSDDGKTLDFLLDQDDVEVYSTIQAYSQSLYGVKWVELLIQAKRIGKWNLVVDADELLLLDSQYNTFTDLCVELDKEGYDSINTPFLDMYSNGPINDTKYSSGTEILNTCAYHDKHFYTAFNIHGGIMGECNTYQGGIRSRAFSLDSVVLNKLPLFKFYPKQKLREGLHWIDNATPAYGKAVLLHFKYIETFHQYVISEIKRGQHWNGASEYRQYYHFLTANPTFSLYDATLSTKFTSVKDFYDNLFEPYYLREKN